MVHLTSLEESYMIDTVNNSTCFVTFCTLGRGYIVAAFLGFEQYSISLLLQPQLKKTDWQLEIVMPTLSNYSIVLA